MTQQDQEVDLDELVCTHGLIGRCEECQQAAKRFGLPGLRLTRGAADRLAGKGYLANGVIEQLRSIHRNPMRLPYLAIAWRLIWYVLATLLILLAAVVIGIGWGPRSGLDFWLESRFR